MVREILIQAGLFENKTFKQTRFMTPPTTDYAVYDIKQTIDGDDFLNTVFFHKSATIKLYKYKNSSNYESNIERELTKKGLIWTKEVDYISVDALYEVTYTFEYAEKNKE